MRRRPKLTLAQWFTGTTLALALVVVATFSAFLESSLRTNPGQDDLRIVPEESAKRRRRADR
jgi:hypothetical protein